MFSFKTFRKGGGIQRQVWTPRKQEGAGGRGSRMEGAERQDTQGDRGQEGAKGSRGEQESEGMGQAFPHDFHSCQPALGLLDEEKLNAQTRA